ncbi:MAG: hypothetical protein Q9167_004071 [Letrouitia subvulpina]
MTALRPSVDTSVVSASSRIPTRLIYCVDGTYCTPDGTDRRSHDNINNVYRIYASVKRGLCHDESTKKNFNQEKIYEEGIGSADDINFFKKAKAAWFVGAHIDMGGSSEKDGFALYPLQWILGESQSKGLVLEFEELKPPWSGTTGIDNPLRVIFPEDEEDGKGQDTWTCVTKNRVHVRMQDLRKVHGFKKYRDRYSIKLNSREQSYWPRKAREVFNSSEELRGYCGWEASQGTIIHPSVYYCLDDLVPQVSILSKMPDRTGIENWRAKMLGTKHRNLDQGFWNDAEPLEDSNLKAIRILVCGNTGVGKSTLINRVFGVESNKEVTEISDCKRGRHDVQEGIVHENRPDLIIHDSGGFEAGDESQIRAVSQFVRERSLMPRIEDQLHVICARTRQTATDNLFKAVSEHTVEVPVIIIA